MQIILASASPRRKELLKQLFESFSIMTSDCEEKAEFISPQQYVKDLSNQKAIGVKEKLEQTSGISEDYLIIGSDTIVFHNGHVLGKPSSDEHARHMLTELAGRSHHVYTGVTLLHCSKEHHLIKQISLCECTVVSVAPLSPMEIDAYIASGEPFDKAGAYGIQGIFAKHICKIDGDYYNVVGLPLHALYNALQINHLLPLPEDVQTVYTT